MTTLLTLSRDAEAALIERTATVCVTYIQSLPIGATPTVARIGIGPAGLGRALYVDRGVQYAGDDERVRDWLEHGVTHFPDVPTALAWVRDVSPDPAEVPDPAAGALGRPTPAPIASVTTLADVIAPTTNEQTVVSSDELFTHLADRVHGQEPALRTLCGGVARHVGKLHPRAPYSALLVGRTGLGKSQTARALRDALAEAGSEWEFIQFDLAEFSDRFAVTRLVGAPPGYVGYGDGGDLAARLAAHPRSVVVFDECEKAHPAVREALLGLLDTGRLTSDRHGDVSAAQAILLFTSNLAADSMNEEIDDNDARAALRSHGFAPELIGRFRDVVPFPPLAPGALGAVAAQTVGVVAADYGVEVAWIDPGYLTGVLARLHANRFGIRMMQHLVDADLGEQLAAASSTRVRVDSVAGIVSQVDAEDRS